MTNRIVVDRCANTDIEVFDVSVELGSQCNFTRPLRESEGSWVSMNETGKKLIQKIFTISGVQRVFVKAYSLQVERGRAFLWTEIEPAILEALKEIHGKNVEIKIKDNTASYTAPSKVGW